MFSRRRWNYENNCAAIVCYVSTGLATSSTQLVDLSDDIIQRHKKLAQSLTVDNIRDILKYTLNKLLKAKCCSSIISTDGCSNNIDSNNLPIRRNSSTPQLPAIHFKIFYQVSAQPQIDLLIDTILEFKESYATQTSIAFTVLPACNLQNFSTFLSICGIRHE